MARPPSGYSMQRRSRGLQTMINSIPLLETEKRGSSEWHFETTGDTITQAPRMASMRGLLRVPTRHPSIRIIRQARRTCRVGRRLRMRAACPAVRHLRMRVLCPTLRARPVRPIRSRACRAVVSPVGSGRKARMVLVRVSKREAFPAPINEGRTTAVMLGDRGSATTERSRQCRASALRPSSVTNSCISNGSGTTRNSKPSSAFGVAPVAQASSSLSGWNPDL